MMDAAACVRQGMMQSQATDHGLLGMTLGNRHGVVVTALVKNSVESAGDSNES
jgi:hypothetical protein